VTRKVKPQRATFPVRTVHAARRPSALLAHARLSEYMCRDGRAAQLGPELDPREGWANGCR